MPKSPRHPISTPVPELQGIATIAVSATTTEEKTRNALEDVAIALWHRFAPDSHIEWEDEIHKGEYRDAAAQVAALIATPPVVEEGRREAVERDIRIAIWNAGKWQGKPDEVAQSLIRKAMAEPTMIRALSALSTPVAAQGDEVREALELLRQAMNALGCADKNDPLEPIADNGMTVWDGMRSESNRLWSHYRKLLATLKDSSHEG